MQPLVTTRRRAALCALSVLAVGAGGAISSASLSGSLPAVSSESAAWATDLLQRLASEEAEQRVQVRLALDRLELLSEFRSMGDGAELIWAQAPLGWVQAEIGQRLAAGRQFEAARVPLLRAAESTPETGVLLLLAATEWELGDVASAAGHFQEAVGLARTQDDARGTYRALRQLGALELWVGDYEAAARALDAAAELPPAREDRLLELDRARAYEGWARSMAEGAEGPLLRDAVPGASAPGETNDRAAAAQRLVTRARDLFSAAARLLPQNSEVRYGLARVLAQLGDRDGAAREFQTYQRLYQEDQLRIRNQGRFDAQLAEVRARIESGLQRESIDLLREMPPRLEVLELLAELYLQLGDEAQALSALQRAVALSPDRTDLMVWLNALLLQP